jgi:hypothetical protein
MDWIYKGNKALHGTDKLWAVGICLVIFLIVTLYQLGAFDGIISKKISGALKKIDRSIDHSANRPSDEKGEKD